MAGIIPKQTLEEIRARIDIVEFIGNHVSLKRAGSSFKGLCPFHKEKTPSFNVNPERQVYRCFGCNESGDIFSFVMRYESVDFTTAARLLADRAGVLLEYTQQEKKERVEKDILFKLLDELSVAYAKWLTASQEAAGARAYLAERQIDEQTIKQFGLGYAPNSRNAVQQWAEKKDYTVKQLEAAGLIGRSQDSSFGNPIYDRFRNRLMFPIQDELGRVIGFSGRTLEPETNMAKYINSPETLVFKKSRVLYGLDKARQAIVDSRQAILCEGQIDVIRCQSTGIANAVAPQGTALTEDHARLLKRYADEVVLVFDADAAGQKAALRSAQVLVAGGMSISMAALPKGEDPDSFIRKEGAPSFQDLAHQAKSVVDFQIDMIGETQDLTSEAGILRATRAVLETIRHVPTASHRDRLIQQAAKRFGLQEDALRQDFRQLSRRRYTSTSEREAQPEEAQVKRPHEETELVSLILRYPEVKDLVRDHVMPGHLTDPVCRTLFEHLMNPSGPDDEDIHLALSGEDQECVRLVAHLQMENKVVGSEETSPTMAAQDLILVVIRKSVERKRADLRHKTLEAQDNEKEIFQAECLQLTQDLNTLKQGWDKAFPILDILKSQLVD